MTSAGTGNGINRIIEAKMDGMDPLRLSDAEWLARPQVGKATLHAIKRALPEYRASLETEHAVEDMGVLA